MKTSKPGPREVPEVRRGASRKRRRLAANGNTALLEIFLMVVFRPPKLRNGLDFSADNVELTYPDINFGALMTDGFMQLV